MAISRSRWSILESSRMYASTIVESVHLVEVDLLTEDQVEQKVKRAFEHWGLNCVGHRDSVTTPRSHITRVSFDLGPESPLQVSTRSRVGPVHN